MSSDLTCYSRCKLVERFIYVIMDPISKWDGVGGSPLSSKKIQLCIASTVVALLLLQQ
jgi:hypothetical protein